MSGSGRGQLLAWGLFQARVIQFTRERAATRPRRLHDKHIVKRKAERIDEINHFAGLGDARHDEATRRRTQLFAIRSACCTVLKFLALSAPRIERHAT